MSTPTATPYPSRLWLYFQETHGMVLTASEESDIRHAANAAAESDIRTLETELAASQSLCSRRDDLLLKAQTELAAAQQEAAHYMSVAQKATDELARLRAEVERLTKQNRDEESWWKEKHDYQARAERAEAECLEQARLLGMSGEREADLLSKLAAKKP